MESVITLDGLFRERVKRTPTSIAYKEFNATHQVWRDYTWEQIARQVRRWQTAMKREELQTGDRVALMLRNGISWVIYDQAALGLGLVNVPLYTSDRPDNVAYIIRDSGAKILLLERPEHWDLFAEVESELSCLVRILVLYPLPTTATDPRLAYVEHWLPEEPDSILPAQHNAQSLASVIYTSGTTGRPKGVMLSHHNILSNAYYSLQTLDVWQEDLFLSFLPLSHTFERTVGYYLTIMTGSTVAYARSIPQLGEDLLVLRPTILISVPRIYERVVSAIKAKLSEGGAIKRYLFNFTVNVGYGLFEYQQQRAKWRIAFLLWPLLKRLVAKKVLEKFGGRIRVALSGGAALPQEISRLLLGLGLPILQGYGLTETSPVVCCNRLGNNIPTSVGKALEKCAVKIGDNGELQVKGPNVMLGYWNNPEATSAVIDSEGWFHTGDTARIDAAGFIYITGRIKEIIVMSNGEKIPPLDMESAIVRDPLFEQVMIIGEGRPYLSALVVLNPDHWKKFAVQNGLSLDMEPYSGDEIIEKLVLGNIGRQIKEFPGYAQVRRAYILKEPWSIENGFLTPTMKLRRTKVVERYETEINQLYRGH
jgi:long-chain acyl-CoA synthetase